MKSYWIKNFTVSTLDASYLVYTDYPYAILRLKVYTVVSYRYYSTSKSDSQSSDPDEVTPVPIFTINNLNKEDCKKSYRTLLKGKGGNTDYGYKLRHYLNAKVPPIRFSDYNK